MVCFQERVLVWQDPHREALQDWFTDFDRPIFQSSVQFRAFTQITQGGPIASFALVPIRSSGLKCRFCKTLPSTVVM